MNVREIAGVLTAIVIVAGLAVVVARGGDSAQIITASGNAFSGAIRAATLRG